MAVVFCRTMASQPGVRPSALVLCANVPRYTAAVEMCLQASASALDSPGPLYLPIIAGEGAPPRGFPSAIELHHDVCTLPGSLLEWSAPEGPRGSCIAVDEPVCRAAATLLARLSGRRLTVVEPAAYESTLDASFADGDPASITMVVPGWRAPGGQVTPEWLRRSLTFLRASQARVGRRPFGILTAPTAAAMTQLVAKALLQRAVTRAYADHPTCLIVSHRETPAGEPIPSGAEMDAGHPLLLFDQSSVESGQLRRLIDRPASALVVSAHGRAYCAADGCFCAARSIFGAAGAEIDHCVMGMRCADPSFQQIDPRRYDAPIVVLDCCYAASWGAPVWETGVPAIAYFALAGPASAVLTSDVPTLDYPVLDLLRALHGSRTLGEAAAQLCAERPEAGAEYPYFVLGDPEIATGPDRWTRWLAQPPLEPLDSEGTRFRGTIDLARHPAPLHRVVIPVPGEHPSAQGEAHGASPRTVFLTHDGGPDDLAIVSRHRHPRGIEIWLRRATRPGPLALSIEQRPSLRLPAATVSAARQVRPIVSAWSTVFAGEPLAEVLAASDAVVALDAQLEALAGEAAILDPRAIEPAVASTLGAWMRAQLACCRAAIANAPHLWQSSFWHCQRFRGQSIEVPCPLCGLSPMIDRIYDSGTAASRSWRECARCGIDGDRPLVEGYPHVEVKSPPAVVVGIPSRLGLRFANASSADWYGAGAVAIAGSGHGLEIRPTSFLVVNPAGTTVEQAVELSLPAPAPIPHVYRLVVVVLLNNHWFWAPRNVMVGV